MDRTKTGESEKGDRATDHPKKVAGTPASKDTKKGSTTKDRPDPKSTPQSEK